MLRRVEALRSRHPDAGHHAWAWRSGERFRYSDDGEPTGTAGRPILQQLDGRSLDRCGVIVTRIFGGTKLGSGGLARAYGKAAADTLSAGRVIEVVPTRSVTGVLPYALVGALDAVATAQGLEAIDEEYAAEVRKRYRVRLEALSGFVEELRERTANRAVVQVSD